MSKEQLIGTWLLVSIEARHSDGTVEYPYGKDAIGRLIYDSFGNMCAVIFRRERPRFASPDFQKGTDQEVRTAFTGLISYFGTYTLSDDGRTIDHHVEGAFFPNWEGDDQRRFYEIIGDMIHISTPTLPFRGKTITGVLSWKRAS